MKGVIVAMRSIPIMRVRSGLAAIAAISLSIVASSVVSSGASAAEGPYDPYFAAAATAVDLGASTRPFGVAAGDYDGDGNADMVVGRSTGNVHFLKGSGDGTFAPPVQFAWKQAFFNGWAFASADVNGDGNLDVVWGANAASSGCSVPGIGCVVDTTVNDGEIRTWLGNGDGTFQTTTYFVSGVNHNAGVLVADIGTDAGSIASADIDGDGDIDLIAGATEGVSLLVNNGDGSFASSPFTPSGVTTDPPTGSYFPAISTQNSPWGLAFGDIDGDGDLDLFLGDRALYVYLYENDGAGTFTLVPGNIPALGAARANVYLRHDTFRAAVGYTPSLAAADVNGDGRSDLFVGLHSGTQTPATGAVNDGSVILHVSEGASHKTVGVLADLGTMTRGLQTVDLNADGASDVVGGVYEGQVKVLRQLPPLDTDGDGVSDYVDNAPTIANAARLDMNTDAAINAADQLDNDFDTVLGDPEDSTTWQRLGDPADPDDDNDGVSDDVDNCVLTANPDQADRDFGVESLVRGDACDPLDDRDEDGDGVPTGPRPGDPLHDLSRAAAAKWSQGDTHFVIRIDALGRFFQNEFTQLMTDAAILDPTEWEQKCWENYGPGDPPEQCGTGEGTDQQALTLGGGREVPISLVTIPRLLWTDAPVVDWVNDRNASPRFDLAMHATYHSSNTMLGDWKDDADRNYFSCELCGFTVAEGQQLLQVGKDTLLGNYDNRWLRDSGATSASPMIDWSDAAVPLISYAPPFNADDTNGRAAAAALGFRAYSSSVFEENSPIFTPEGSHFEQFDQFGMFHASADVELDPPDTVDGSYDPAEYAQFLDDNTEQGGLNTWLIEEVEWSGRPCNDDPRVGPNFTDVPAECTADPNDTNRENNTVYQPRWDAWLQLLDHVKSYPGGVVMTMAEVALAKGYDNAPTVPNPDQADSDHDGIGDVVDGAGITAADHVALTRGVVGTLSATLTGPTGPLAGQEVSFTFDADGDDVDEIFTGTTDVDGVATVAVTTSRPVGTAPYAVSWTDGIVTVTDIAELNVGDLVTLTLDPVNPASGQATDVVTLGATLEDSDGEGIPGVDLTFSVGDATATGTTDGQGHATADLHLVGPAGPQTVTVSFAGGGGYGPSAATGDIEVLPENTSIALSTEAAPKNGVVLVATLTEDGGPVAGRTITFTTPQKVKGQVVTETLGTVDTNADGDARLLIPAKYLSKTPRPMSAVFGGDTTFVASSATIEVAR